MSKYNITTEIKKDAAYKSRLSEASVDRLAEGIKRVVIDEKKYRDPNFSALELSKVLETNTRYISAVVSLRFGRNFASFINELRVNYAKTLLTDRRNARIRVEDIGHMAGFSNRQSFYASFYKFTGITPKEYRFANAKPARRSPSNRDLA